MSDMSRKTALNPSHHALHARMVDFHGWEMPLHYGSQLEEHHAVRRDCGMFDISHMCTVDVAGADAKAFLLRLLANSVAKLREPGHALYGCMLNEAGGVLDDLIVYFMAQRRYRLVLNSATAEADLAWMAAHAVEWLIDVHIAPRRDLAMLALQGPHAREKLWRALPHTRLLSCGLTPFSSIEIGDLFIARTGYSGEDGFEISLPEPQAPALWQALRDAGVTPCGLGARDTLRLEAGMKLYGQDMDETVSPLDAGLGWTVAFDTGRDFVGRTALLARPQQWQMLGLILNGGGVLRAQQRVITAGGDGIITSGTFSPTLQQSIALARLPMMIGSGDTVVVDIRGNRHDARVVKPPFVRNGRVLV